MTTIARRLLELTTGEAADLARGGAVALLPVGQVVPHGPHLPLGTDALIACGVAERLADRLDLGGLPAVVAPSLPLGHAPLHGGGAGTLSLSASTLGAALGDVTAGLARSGFDRQVILLHAPGSWPSVGIAADGDGPARSAMTIDLLAWLRGTAESVAVAIDGPDGHAGALETSVMQHLHPGLADPARAPAGRGPDYGWGRPEFRGLSTNERLAAFGVTSWRRLGDGGVVGDARQADPAIGAAVVEAAVAGLASHVTEVIDAASREGEVTDHPEEEGRG